MGKSLVDGENPWEKPAKMFPSNPVMACWAHPVFFTPFSLWMLIFYICIYQNRTSWWSAPLKLWGVKKKYSNSNQKKGENSCACIFGSDFICQSFLGLLLYIWNHQPDLLPFWTCPLIGNVKATIASSPMFLDSSKNWDAVQFVDALSHYLQGFVWK